MRCSGFLYINFRNLKLGAGYDARRFRGPFMLLQTNFLSGFLAFTFYPTSNIYFKGQFKTKEVFRKLNAAKKIQF
jgi:hypothetical protein